MEKSLKKVLGSSMYMSKKASTLLHEIRRSCEGEGQPTPSLADVLDALLDAQKKNPQRLVIQRRWTVKRAWNQLERSYPELVAGEIDSEKVRQIHKFFAARADETEKALKSEQESAPVQNGESSSRRSRNRKSGAGSEGVTETVTPAPATGEEIHQS